jgi:hypothetical protein
MSSTSSRNVDEAVLAAERDAPRRLTLADAYRDAQHVIDQLTTRAPGEPSASVEITRNAAGNAQFTIKAYTPASADESELKAAMEHAYNVAMDAYDAASVQHPHFDKKKDDEAEREARAAAAIARSQAKSAGRPAAVRPR